MSRSNPSAAGSAHISTRWLEYKGDVGEFSYYDKEATNEDGTKGANVNIGKKFTFLWLDETYSITGFSEGGGGVTSNEFKDISNTLITVRQLRSGASFSGHWNKSTTEGEAFIAKAKAIGGKFTANLYIAYKDEQGELKIGVLQLKGAAYSKWSEFSKRNKGAIHAGAVTVSEHEDGRKGAVKFKTPVFRTIEVSEENNRAAVALDEQLQAFLKERLAAAPVQAPVAETPAPTSHVTAAPAPAPAQKELRGADVDAYIENQWGYDLEHMPNPNEPSTNSPTHSMPPPPSEEDFGAMYGEEGEDSDYPF